MKNKKKIISGLLCVAVVITSGVESMTAPKLRGGKIKSELLDRQEQKQNDESRQQRWADQHGTKPRPKGRRSQPKTD